jgi:pyridoxal 5'-phosphate synthase pdxT subunit
MLKVSSAWETLEDREWGTVKIGVLALQGDFALHRAALERCGAQAIEVRKPDELAGIDGLIIPGGESTTLLKLMDAWNFVPALEQFGAAGKPLFGTCAGLIVLAHEVVNPKQFSLGLIDVDVERNAYGRQRDSFEAHGQATLDGETRPLEMVFIRAPRIRRTGSGVEVLAALNEEPVMARQGAVLVATFHPELTTDPTVHRYFCRLVESSLERRSG